MKLLEEGDIDEALNTTNAVGGDRIQETRGATSCRTDLLLQGVHNL